jgi:hypothetical protein
VPRHEDLVLALLEIRLRMENLRTVLEGATRSILTESERAEIGETLRALADHAGRLEAEIAQLAGSAGGTGGTGEER